MSGDNSAVDPYLASRQRMIEQDIRRRGVRDPRVLDAMATIPRERFVPVAERASAYEDHALSIDFGQTISQPFIVAYMTELLAVTPDAKVLEIGTGSGYQTAVLARLARTVHTVERIDALRERAAQTISALRLNNIVLHAGDGSLGLPALAPFDRIIVTAAAPRVPPPLVVQLADGGRLVIPVGGDVNQTIVQVIREGSRTIETPMLACRFVKLIGQEGWGG
ncbi:MAG: protein-L-isoaspartate(D-aspartate) O-methyltransferase [Planctomycetota bacterium]